jgi:hypothetical protein
MIKRYVLGAVVVIVGLAFFDVSTGIQLLDEVIRAVPL